MINDLIFSFLKRRKAARTDSFSGPKSNPIVNLNVRTNIRDPVHKKHEISHVLKKGCLFLTPSLCFLNKS
jgi:hypothetical protein